jgi:hypothetical protein
MSIDSGWTDYLFKRAPSGILCQFARVETSDNGGYMTKPWVGVQDDFRPEYNVAGLYWRLTGIGREQLERCPHLRTVYCPWRLPSHCREWRSIQDWLDRTNGAIGLFDR